MEEVCSKKDKPLIKFIIHGFAETWNMTMRWNWVKELVQEMMASKEADKLCVIVVDWKVTCLGRINLKIEIQRKIRVHLKI